jgi:riboflavin biosynthesis pyrimidine reductase
VKPHVICHIGASVDGRILTSRWRPQNFNSGGLFERLHEELGCDAWLVGRVTGQEYAKATRYPGQPTPRLPREPWFARRAAKAYGVVLDADGKIAWGRSDIGGDPIVVVLNTAVSDAHLNALRSEGVSYIFGGEVGLDLACVLEVLNHELGVERLLVEGGGVTNGAFLRAGLIDELSLMIYPVVDGAAGAPCIFDSAPTDAGHAAPLRSMKLESSQSMPGGSMWLRYRMENA